MNFSYGRRLKLLNIIRKQRTFEEIAADPSKARAKSLGSFRDKLESLE